MNSVTSGVRNLKQRLGSETESEAVGLEEDSRMSTSNDYEHEFRLIRYNALIILNNFAAH